MFAGKASPKNLVVPVFVFSCCPLPSPHTTTPLELALRFLHTIFPTESPPQTTSMPLSTSPSTSRRLVGLLALFLHQTATITVSSEAVGSSTSNLRGAVVPHPLPPPPIHQHSCPVPAPAGTMCPPQTPHGPVTCTKKKTSRAGDSSTNKDTDEIATALADSAAAAACHYDHMCDALSSGYYLVGDCTPIPTSRALEEAEQLQTDLDRANAILLTLDLNNTKRVQRIFRRFNVSDEDAPFVLHLAQSLQDEQNSVSLMGTDSASSGSLFANQPLVMIPVPTPALGGAWTIGDIVVGVGCGLGIEFGIRYGRLELRPDYFRTSEICQYQMNSFSFIVGYTNINLFKGGTWVGTYHSAGVGIGTYFATGAAFFCGSEGQDPLDCLAN